MAGPEGREVERPEQAVILAGGRGTRLGVLTDTLPKPMIEVAGKPFLQHLLELLRDRGFSRILLLLGYLPESIQEYFGSGAELGLRIDYSISSPDDETGTRLRLAEARLDPRFLLAYADVYWPLVLQPMLECWELSGSAAQITAYTNRDGYSRSNLRIEPDGRVVEYDKSRTRPGLDAVDIGFLLLERSTIDLIPLSGNPSLEETLYPALVSHQELSAFRTDHRYYGIGSPERLDEARSFFSSRPTVLLDRDGVLNRKPSPAEYVCHWSEWEWLPGAKDALSLLSSHGYRVAVVTNQAGIARGQISPDELTEIHARMKREAEDAGGRIDVVYHCPHGWDQGCECRKPAPGMFLQAQRDLAIDLTRTPFIGDDSRDAEAASRAGCPFIRVDDERRLIDVVKEMIR